MKRYIQSGVIIEKNWQKLVKGIENDTGLKASRYYSSPTRYLTFFGNNNDMYEATIEFNRDGTYEYSSNNLVKCSQSINASVSTSVFDGWNEAYDLIEKVIEMYIDNGSKSVDLKVESLNSVFRGDHNWDEAYKRFHEEF